MNKLSDEEKIIKKAMEEFEIPFDAAAWEKAEILLDKQVKTKWLFKSLIALSVLAVLSISIYLFSSEKSPVSDIKLMVQNANENLQSNHKNEKMNVQNTDENSDEILTAKQNEYLDKKYNMNKENETTENINQVHNNTFSSKKNNSDVNETNIDLSKKDNTKSPVFSSKKEKLNTGSNDNFLSKKSNSNSAEINKNNFASQENISIQNNQKENNENKNPILAKNEETNTLTNTETEDENIAKNNTDNSDKIAPKPNEDLIAKAPENITTKDTSIQQKDVVIPEPFHNYDKRFIMGVSAGITAYKKIDKQKTSSLDYTPVLGIFIQKNITQKIGIKAALNYNQNQLNNISKTYNGSTYSFGKISETITVSPMKLHLLHSNISLLYQFRPQLNFQLGVAYVYAFNSKTRFEENKQDYQVANYINNSKFFNGYQAIPALQFGSEYQNKKGLRYGAYLQQGMKNLVNEKQFGNVQSNTLFNINIYMAYDLSRF